MNGLSGVINIYKEKGYTSSDVVSVVRKALSCKTGHAGTLDPQAVGVLPVLIGKATKIADYIGCAKRYQAGLQLGVTTDTDDLTGKVLTEIPVNAGMESIKNTVRTFLGETLQAPPMYSAVKIGGKKLYELARAGKVVERAPRPVNISQIDVIDYNPDTHMAIIDVTCSRGTYIRSLCADIGRALNCGGCMGELVRTLSGPFCISNSITLGRLKEYIADNRVNEIVAPIESVLKYKMISAQFQEKLIANGNPVLVSACENGYEVSDGEYAFLTLNGITAGLYVRAGDVFRLRVMLYGE